VPLIAGSGSRVRHFEDGLQGFLYRIPATIGTVNLAGTVWRKLNAWPDAHPYPWMLFFGAVMGSIWFFVPVAMGHPYGTLSTRLVGSVIFGVIMGLSQGLALRLRRRRAARLIAEHSN
jgi:hypothetical protein